MLWLLLFHYYDVPPPPGSCKLVPTGNYGCLVNLHTFHSDILAVFIMLRFFSSIVVVVDVAVVVMIGCALVFLLLLWLTFHSDILAVHGLLVIMLLFLSSVVVD